MCMSLSACLSSCLCAGDGSVLSPSCGSYEEFTCELLCALCEKNNNVDDIVLEHCDILWYVGVSMCCMTRLMLKEMSCIMMFLPHFEEMCVPPCYVAMDVML